MKKIIFVILSSIMITACSDHSDINNQHKIDVVIECIAYNITTNSVSISGSINGLSYYDIRGIKIAYSSSNALPSLSIDNVYTSTGISHIGNNPLSIRAESISGLSADKQYYFKVYVETQNETYSSEVITATTKQSIVSTIEVKDVTIASAKVVGRVNDSSILPTSSLNIGIYYGVSENNLNTRVYLSEYGEVFNDVNFEIILTNLNENTAYYVRSFIYIYGAEELGEVLNFTTPKQNDSGIFLGDLNLSSNEDVEKFGNENYNEIQGSLNVLGNEIKTLQRLGNKLKKVDGNVVINASNLTTLDGLYGLESISGNLEVSFTDISTFEGLNNLYEVGGDLEISYLNSLLSFSGLNSLTKIGNNFIAKGLTQIKSFTGFEKLYEIGGNFEIGGAVIVGGVKQMYNLKTFDGLDVLQNIKGDFFINGWADLNNLISFEGLSSLKRIDGAFHIFGRASDNDGSSGRSLNKLYSFKGLENLEYVGENFKIEIVFSINNTVNEYELSALESLTSFEGLNRLRSIGGDISVTSAASRNPYAKSASKALSNFSSFKGLSSFDYLGGNLNISISGGGSVLNSLESFEGFESFEKIYGDLLINATGLSLSKFSSFKGLENLTQIMGNMEITASNLVSFENLVNFKGLDNLKYIGENLNILSTYTERYNPYPATFKSLTSIVGLNNLVNITENLTLSNLSELHDIQPLSKLGHVQNITIESCPNLFDFTPLKDVLTNYDHVFYTNDNGYDPTRYQILNGQGKP